MMHPWPVFPSNYWPCFRFWPFSSPLRSAPKKTSFGSIGVSAAMSAASGFRAERKTYFNISIILSCRATFGRPSRRRPPRAASETVPSASGSTGERFCSESRIRNVRSRGEHATRSRGARRRPPFPDRFGTPASRLAPAVRSRAEGGGVETRTRARVHLGGVGRKRPPIARLSMCALPPNGKLSFAS